MSRYFRVKAGTPQWELFNKLWTYQESWKKVHHQLNQLFGCEVVDNLAANTDRVYMTNPPEHLLSQFSKYPNKDGFYKAKSRSKIHKQWKSFVKVYQLTSYNPIQLIWDLHVDDLNSFDSFYAMMKGDYYFDLRDKASWRGYDWAIEVDETTFLRIRTDLLEENKQQQPAS